MDPILFFCLKHQQNILNGLDSRRETPAGEDMERMIQGLRSWRVLFKALHSTRPHWIPHPDHQESLKRLLTISENLADLCLQADILKETEVITGMDLSYLHQYTMDLTVKAQTVLDKHLKRFDDQFPLHYGEYLTRQLAKDDPGLLHNQLVQFTYKKIKKALKRVSKKDRLKKMSKLRRQLIDTHCLLDLVDFEDFDGSGSLKNASFFLEIWHNRRVCLLVIDRYRKEHPGQACRYSGTMEILEDYMQQKAGII